MTSSSSPLNGEDSPRITPQAFCFTNRCALTPKVTDSELWSGLARTASTLGAALLGIPLGVAATHFGRRTALASGWWISAVGAAVLVVAAQWSLVVPMFLGLLLIGAGQATSLQSRFAATDRATSADQARSLSLIVWVGTIGNVLGPNLGVPGEMLHRSTGLTVYAAAFLIAAVGLAIAGVVVFVWLRPDSLVGKNGQLRQDTASPNSSEENGRSSSIHLLLTEIRASPQARTAATAVVYAQIIMVVIMTMTPVHLSHHGDTITLVGITISLHILGMYAFSPLVGQLTDRKGARVSVLTGLAVFAASLATSGVAADSTGGVILGLFLLGLGWSFVNVVGSAMFAQAVSGSNRATAQGGLDTASNLVSAVGAFAAGPLMAVSSFPVVALVTAAFLLPVILTLPTRAYRHGD